MPLQISVSAISGSAPSASAPGPARVAIFRFACACRWSNGYTCYGSAPAGMICTYVPESTNQLARPSVPEILRGSVLAALLINLAPARAANLATGDASLPLLAAGIGRPVAD